MEQAICGFNRNCNVIPLDCLNAMPEVVCLIR